MTKVGNNWMKLKQRLNASVTPVVKTIRENQEIPKPHASSPQINTDVERSVSNFIIISNHRNTFS